MSNDTQWQMTDEENGHRWGYWKKDKFQCCRNCCLVRRADGKSKPCKGPAKITLRIEKD